MSKAKAPVLLTKEQIKEIEKQLRSSHDDVLLGGVGQIAAEFFESSTSLSTLMNNMNEKKSVAVHHAILKKFAQVLNYSAASVSLAYQMMVDGEKKTTKWEGCERITLYLSDADALVSASSVKIVRHIIEGVSQLPPSEKRAQYLGNILNVGKAVPSLSHQLSHPSPEVRLDALCSLCLLSPRSLPEDSHSSVILGFVPQVYEEMMSNAGVTSALAAFYDNEVVNAVHQKAFCLLNGLSSLPSSYPLLFQILPSFVPMVRSIRLCLQTLQSPPTEKKPKAAPPKKGSEKTASSDGLAAPVELSLEEEYDLMYTWGYHVLDTLFTTLCNQGSREWSARDKEVVTAINREVLRFLSQLPFSEGTARLHHRMLKGVHDFCVLYGDWVSQSYLHVRSLKVLLRKFSTPDMALRDEIERCLLALIQGGRSVFPSESIVMSLFAREESDESYLQMDLLKVLLETPHDDYDYDCRLLRFVNHFLYNRDNQIALIESGMISVLYSRLLAYRPVTPRTSPPPPAVHNEATDDAISDLECTVYSCLMSITQQLLVHSSAQSQFSAGMQPPYNAEEYEETEWESDTEFQLSAVEAKGGRVGSSSGKKPVAKKASAGGPKKTTGKDAKSAGKKGKDTVESPVIEFYPVDILLSWFPALTYSLKRDLQLTLLSDHLDSCYLKQRCIEVLWSLSMNGRKFSDVSLTELKSSFTLLYHIHTLMEITMLPIDPLHEMVILKSLELVTELATLPTGLEQMMSIFAGHPLELPSAPEPPVLVLPKKYTEEEKNHLESEHNDSLKKLDDEFKSSLADFQSILEDACVPFQSTIFQLVNVTYLDPKYLERVVVLLRTLIVVRRPDDALQSLLLDSILMSFLKRGLLVILISLTDSYPFDMSGFSISPSLHSSIDELVRYLLNRGSEKESFSRTEIVMEVPPDPKIKRKAGAKVEPETKVCFPTVYGPLLAEFLVVYNRAFAYDVYHLPECTPLHAAVNVHNEGVIRQLVEQGVDLNVRDGNGLSPLMLALSLGYDRVEGRRVGLAAVRSLLIVPRSQDDTVEYLLSRDVDVNTIDNDGNPVLQYALLSPQESSVKSIQDRFFRHLSIPVVIGSSRLAARLIEKGADPNISDSSGSFPLHNVFKGLRMRCKLRWVESVEVVQDGMEGDDPPQNLLQTVSDLISHGAEVNIVDSHGSTPLHYALSLGHYPSIVHLLDHGADPMIADEEGFIGLHLAALCRIVGKTGSWSDAESILNRLLEFGKNRGVYTKSFVDNKGRSAAEKEKDRLSRFMDDLFESTQRPPLVTRKPMTESSLCCLPQNNGLYPLHLSLRPLESGRYSESSIPRWARLSDDRGEARVKAIACLARLNKSSLKGTLAEGQTVLHQLFQSSPLSFVWDMTDYLKGEGISLTSVCELSDGSGANFKVSPLHFALLHSESLAWKLLSLGVPSSGGDYVTLPPAHLALHLGYSNEMILKLFQGYADPNLRATGRYRSMDFEGTLLENAIRLDCSRVVSCLLELRVSSASCPSLAQSCGSSADILAALSSSAESS